MRRRDKSRRGIATIVTSAILLTAVSLMGSGVVVWSNSNLFGHEQILQLSYSSNINKINEYLTVENVWFGTDNQNPPQQFVNITMNNPGTVGLNVTQIQLKTSTTDITQKFTNQQVLPKSSTSVQFQYQYGSKVPTDIYMTTSRGSIFTTHALSP
ncbi:hypothetical protein HY212_06140 [Candidatus Pacearchaeota archaeon]|nr:hypothetical protein [Candidatus Pacearchaeota archaeon]